MSMATAVSATRRSGGSRNGERALLALLRREEMTRDSRHLLGAFAAMLFVGLVWGANLPVTKVMLLHFDLIPMAAVRIAAATASLALLLLLTEGQRTLRIRS